MQKFTTLFNINYDFSEGNLKGLSSSAVMILVDQAMAELQEQGEIVFGTPEATDEKEKKGELNEHIGDGFADGELKETKDLADFDLDSKKTELLINPDERWCHKHHEHRYI